jgi:hypothetical protein
MNISAASYFNQIGSMLPSSAITSGASVDTSQTGVSGNPTEGGERVPHHHRGGGHMHGAVMQSLAGLGLSSAQTSSASGSGASTTSDPDGDGDGGASDAVSGVRQDMHHFMHALFDAMKSEGASSSASGSSSTSSSGSDPQTSLSSDLSALVTQVSNGNAPTDLQNAFSKLVSDLQGSASASGASGTTAAGTSTTGDPTVTASAATPTLQDFLTKLQSTLGYGSGAVAASGNLVSAQA